MSVRKVKLSQLQQEGREFLRKQRLLKESLQNKKNPAKEEEHLTPSDQELRVDNQPQADNHERLTGDTKIQRKITNQKEIFHNKQRQANSIQAAKNQLTSSNQQIISNQSTSQVENKSIPPALDMKAPSSSSQPVLANKITTANLPTDPKIGGNHIGSAQFDGLEQDLMELTNAGSVIYKIPVFFSHQDLATIGPAEAPSLSTEQQFVIRMFKEIKNVLLFPRTLPNTNQFPDTRIDQIRTIIQASYGTAAVLVEPTEATLGEPYNPFSQFEPAMAYNSNHPLLLVIQDTMKQGAGGVWSGTGSVVSFGPLVWHSRTMSVEEFFESMSWKEALFNWASTVRNHYFTKTGQRQ